jgi:hypothetical protein
VSKYDFFISHAGADKERYIEPLVSALEARGVSCWLDRLEVGWGDNITLKLSEGLRDSRFVLLCLSRNFLRRPWPETEFGAALGQQNSDGVKRVLPLILNSREEILTYYPILVGLAYREFSAGIDSLSEELAGLVRTAARTPDRLRVRAESVHTSKSCELLVEPRVSIRWLSERLQAGMGLSAEAQTGAYAPFVVRWVLVDVRAEGTWRTISRAEQRRVHAIVMSDHRLRFSYSDRDRVEDLGISDGTIFHLYPVEDEDVPLDDACAKMGF